MPFGDFCDDLFYELNYIIIKGEDPKMYKIWKNKFQKVAKLHAPSKIKVMKNGYSLWLTDDLKRQMNYCDYLKKRAIKNKFACYHFVFIKKREIN